MRTESQKADDLEYIQAAVDSSKISRSPYITVSSESLETVLAELKAYKTAVSSILRVPGYSATDPGSDDFKEGFNHRTRRDRNIIVRHLNGQS